MSGAKPAVASAASESEATVETARRILCVVRHPIGGITAYLRYVYGRLDPSRVRFTVVSPRNEQSEKFASERGWDVRYVPAPAGPAGLVRMAWSLIGLLREERFDAIHSQGATAGALVAAINVWFRVAHVITLHETFDDRSIGGRRAAIARRVLGRLYAGAERINVVSEDARANLLEHFPALANRAERVVVIHNGVDIEYLERVPAETIDLRAALAIGPAQRVAGYMGRFMPEKGFPVLIEAIGSLAARRSGEPPIVVVAVGSGAYEREYRARIRERGLDPWFRFLGFQSDVRGLFEQLDVLVIPSHREAFSLLAMEALVLGVPVIGSDCVGLREALTGSPAVRVAPGAPAELAAALERFVNAPASDAAQRYRPEARRRFGAAETARRLTALLEEAIVARRNRGAGTDEHLQRSER